MMESRSTSCSAIAAACYWRWDGSVGAYDKGVPRAERIRREEVNTKSLCVVFPLRAC
jgi:hypothetical protein